jgi:hypothetical protein
MRPAPVSGAAAIGHRSAVSAMGAPVETPPARTAERPTAAAAALELWPSSPSRDEPTASSRSRKCGAAAAIAIGRDVCSGLAFGANAPIAGELTANGALSACGGTGPMDMPPPIGGDGDGIGATGPCEIERSVVSRLISSARPAAGNAPTGPTAGGEADGCRGTGADIAAAANAGGAAAAAAAVGAAAAA